MALVVEDGSGNPNAESYVSVADVSAYVAKYGGTFDTSDAAVAEAACRRATRYIDATYRNLFQGTVANTNQQALEWPRSGVYYSNNTLPSDKLPSFLKNAVCEAAIQEKAKPGCLLPVTTAGANITSITADSVSIEYGGAGLAQGVKVFPSIALTLSPLLQQQSSPFNGSAGRG